VSQLLRTAVLTVRDLQTMPHWSLPLWLERHM